VPRLSSRIRLRCQPFRYRYKSGAHITVVVTMPLML
jgi:hypothetical protein